MRRLIESDSDKDKVNAEIQMDVNGLRDGNVGIKHRITETDGSRADAIQNLKMLQMERDR